jgi:hypothetical protein
MKVKIGKYPYRLSCRLHEKHMTKKYGYIDWPDHQAYEDHVIEAIDDIIQSIYNVFNKIYFDRRKQKFKVKIDKQDTWSMDHTLAPIILPMLKQLKETKHGSPMVDLEDVPKEMRTTSTEDYDPQKTFEFYNDPEICKQNNKCDIHDRWDWVMNEMIWAFEQKTRDHWEGDYYGPYIEGEDGKILSGHFEWVDDEGRDKHQKRMSNGFRLFGKYYEGLWD